MDKEDRISYSKEHTYRILEKVYERQDKKSAYYIAEDVDLKRKVGIKQIQKDRTNKQLEEIKMLLRINEATPYVPKIYDKIEQKGNIFIIMQHIEGKTLRQLLTTEPQEILRNHKRIFMKLCMILQEIEYEHRDIKPENIVLTKFKSGQYKDVFLIDFGLASLYPFADEGTKGYQAPEQLKISSKNIKAEKSTKIDMFACGLLLYEMIMGKLPVEGKNYSITEENREWTIFEELLQKGIQAEEINFIKRCLEINPKDRFYNKRDMCFQYQKIK